MLAINLIIIPIPIHGFENNQFQDYYAIILVWVTGHML